MKPPSITWPIVALVALVLAAFVGIFALIPESDPTSRSALLALVVAGGQAIVMVYSQRAAAANARAQQQTQQQLNTVQETVNGHTAAIIAKIPEPEQASVRTEWEHTHNTDLPGPR